MPPGALQPFLIALLQVFLFVFPIEASDNLMLPQHHAHDRAASVAVSRRGNLDAEWLDLIDRVPSNEYAESIFTSAVALNQEATGLRQKTSVLLQQAGRVEATLAELKQKTQQHLLELGAERNLSNSRNNAFTHPRAIERHPYRRRRSHGYNSLRKQALPVLGFSRPNSDNVTTQAQGSPNETAALRALYRATGGDKEGCWTNSTGWDNATKTDVCDGWFGVRCSPRSGSVVALILSNNALCASLPWGSTLAPLTGLLTLDLSWNQIGGKLPTSLPNSLTRLDLSNNPYTGTLPSDIRLLSSLTSLKLTSLPGIKGSLPSAWGIGLRKLEEIQLINLSVRGTIPSVWGRLTNMRELFISLPFLSGGIPSEFGAFSNMQYFSMRDNSALEGGIPTELGLFAHCKQFHVRNSPLLQGTLPSELGALSTLQYLSVHDNYAMQGTLPIEFASFVNASHINLSNNRGMRGTLPHLYSSWLQLETLLMDGNLGLRGTLPDDFSALTKLQEFSIGSNPGLNGTLPPSWGRLTSLQTLELGDCSGLRGSLPPQWAGLSSLQSLQLGNCRLSGTLPGEWAALVTLQELDVSDCPWLEGSLPPSWVSLSSLQHLDAYGCTGLHGPLPSSWGTLARLRYVDLHGCSGLGGATIPNEWADGLLRLETLDLSSIGLEGGLPESWLGRDPDYPWSVDWAETLGNGIVINVGAEARLDPNPVLPELRELYLSKNNLTQNAGETLRRASTLQNLVSLDLSSNALGGEIADKDMLV